MKIVDLLCNKVSKILITKTQKFCLILYSTVCTANMTRVTLDMMKFSFPYVRTYVRSYIIWPYILHCKPCNARMRLISTLFVSFFLGSKFFWHDFYMILKGFGGGKGLVSKKISMANCFSILFDFLTMCQEEKEVLFLSHHFLLIYYHSCGCKGRKIEIESLMMIMMICL
jgi:hypothetical protein